MKDALGHGSNPRGAHSKGVNAVGLTWSKDKKQNLETARRLAESLGHKATIYSNPKSAIAAAWHEDQIKFNAGHKFWRDPKGMAERSTNLSTNDPAGIVHHESGHAKYDAPDNFMTLAHQDMARQHVSKYAAMNPKEFVSEVHAGMMTGKSYPEEVMTAFRQYARPRK